MKTNIKELIQRAENQLNSSMDQLNATVRRYGEAAVHADKYTFSDTLRSIEFDIRCLTRLLNFLTQFGRDKSIHINIEGAIMHQLDAQLEEQEILYSENFKGYVLEGDYDAHNAYKVKFEKNKQNIIEIVYCKFWVKEQTLNNQNQ